MTHANVVLDPRRFRSAMGKFATGVTVLGYLRHGAPAALTANAFMSVSLDPPLILVSLRNASAFLEHVKLGNRFGVSVLAENQRELSDHFGGRSSGRAEPTLSLEDEAPLVEGAIATLVARVRDIHPAGDHRLVIADVERLAETQGRPLLFFGGRYAGLDENVHAPKPKFAAASELAWWSP
jgi:flavin reductase (DIM6/NTAB) family NADH-FMN oxidoreductase RutF